MWSATGDWGSVLDVVEQPVWAVDAGHVVQYANPALVRALGHDRPDDLLGRDGRPLAVPSDELPGAAGMTLPGRGEGVLVGVDGSMLSVEWSVLPLSGTHGDAFLYAFRFPRASADCTPDDRQPRLRLLAHRQAERDHRSAGTLQHNVQERLVQALIGLQLARQDLAAEPARAVGLLSDAARAVEEALAGVREVTDALSPGALRVRGLPAALAALAHRCPVPLLLSGSLTARLPGPVETHLYFFVEEAVERAVRHGRASQVEVRADAGADVVVAVTDNGKRAAGAADTAALAVLAQRVAAVHGTLTVTRTPGTGTTLTAVVPL
ncbi:ATP-binding protein [Streptomyces sp. NPDC005483]|uniref:sensor histidine kinase n=1 Tax=Streptomyces sp. NPDC005483 TaxID=3154882 RepID=UPI00339DB5AD